MEYSIVVEEHASQTMIHTSISGIMSLDERNNIIVATIHVMRENNLHKIIWDIREAKLDYSLIQTHQAVLSLKAVGLTVEDSMAVIYFHNEEQHEHAKLTALNRAVYNLGYFQNFEEGVRWLANR